MTKKFNLTIGIVSCGRPNCLQSLIASFENVTLDINYEIIIVENKGRESEKCIKIINDLANKIKNTKTIILNKNMGFYAAWNIITLLSEGEYYLMLQDDTMFYKGTNVEKKIKISDVLSYMKKKESWILYFGANKPDRIIYSDQPHFEHYLLREKIGNFMHYPKDWSSLLRQNGFAEGLFATAIIESKYVSLERRYDVFWPQFMRHQNSNESLMQTCMHEIPPGLTEKEMEEIYEKHNFEKHNMKRWQ